MRVPVASNLPHGVQSLRGRYTRFPPAIACARPIGNPEVVVVQAVSHRLFPQVVTQRQSNFFNRVGEACRKILGGEHIPVADVWPVHANALWGVAE